MKLFHANFLHRAGNMIGALIGIFENLIVLFTFSFFLPNWTLRWAMFRLHTMFYQKEENKK